MLGMGKLSLLSLLGSRMYYLQISESEKYKTLSDSNHIRLLPVPPKRGLIVDRNNNILALNKINYRVLLTKENNEHLELTIKKLVELLELRGDEKEDFEQKILSQKKQSTVMLFDNLTWRDLSVIELNIPDLPGVYVEVGQIRYYPYNISCAHLIGYVGTVGKDEIRNEAVIYHPDYKIGKNGVEKFFDERLQGVAGYKQVEVDAYGYNVRELSFNESIPGEDIPLGLNIKIQDLIYNNILEGKDAAVVAMDIHTGEILAMCSTPSFDPNKFTQGISKDYWQKLTNNKHLPLINKTISQQYPPGSVFKTVAALAAVESGIDPNMRVECNGGMYVGNHKFHCWKHEGHGALNLEQAIQHSCNIYFYNIVKRIGFDKISEVAKQLGLGDRINIGLIGEVAGIIPNREWKKKKLKQEWHLGDSIICGIGHGYVNVTPLQLAVMTARIASGKKVIPRLTVPSEVYEFEDLNFNEKSLITVRNGMDMVVNQPGGTVYRHRSEDPRYNYAAKTGTGQVIGIKHDSKGKALNENLSWETSHHGICIGYGPVINPRFACATVVEHGGSGAGSAAPVVKEVLLKLQQFS
ncbi:MAG: penicillin-binding protein 2 [Sphingobacteriia bacterium]|nr:penicillin-binding protein 2 [Sphingobacteriia bacterium]